MVCFEKTADTHSNRLKYSFNRIFHAFHCRHVPLILTDVDSSSHGYRLILILHSALNAFTSREMEFLNTGLFCNPADILFVHPTTCKESNSAVRPFTEFLQQRYSKFRRCLLPRSQDTVASQINYLFQSFRRITADIKCPMESDR